MRLLGCSLRFENSAASAPARNPGAVEESRRRRQSGAAAAPLPDAPNSARRTRGRPHRTFPASWSFDLTRNAPPQGTPGASQRPTTTSVLSFVCETAQRRASAAGDHGSARANLRSLAAHHPIVPERHSPRSGLPAACACWAARFGARSSPATDPARSPGAGEEFRRRGRPHRALPSSMERRFHEERAASKERRAPRGASPPPSVLSFERESAQRCASAASGKRRAHTITPFHCPHRDPPPTRS